ncbi:cyclic-AMP response element binding protein B isoform X2 [Arctopsyche grandis]|uniref:cyclic-AMP response element binding protein B isoform X2 n=1 Tax=Arctopsyche grandis TaxID=121162 RepID=UPI00406D7A8A
MDGMVEENGAGSTGSAVESLKSSSSGQAVNVNSHAVTATSIVQLQLTSQAPAVAQSVIQPNQQSVIQTPSNIQSVQMSKANVILLSKPSSVIHTTQGSLQTLQIKSEPSLVSSVVKMDSGSDDSLSDDENPKKRRDLLTRRPSYRKILNELGGAEIAENRLETNSSECESEVSLPPPLPFSSVIPAGALQGEGGLQALTMPNAGSGGTIVQYTSQDGQFFVPVAQGGPMMEDQTRKREMRLLKNREAARECRRKKKEYIKCLENRVAVLENQNKALIDELKALKELYCEEKSK